MSWSDLPFNTTRDFTEVQRVWIALLGVALALAWRLVPGPWRRPALVGLVAIAGLNYARWGPDVVTTRIDSYDLIHYYLNAKYMDELGYLDLYPAVLLVDAENGGPFFTGATQFMAQDAEGHHFAPLAEGEERGRVVRAERFTPERWQAFEHDVLYLQRVRGCYDRKNGKCRAELSDASWNELVNDHGFNGTTAWTVLAQPIANAVPVEYVKWLGYLDVALLGIALALATWTCGADAAWFVVLFLLVTYSTRWPTITWVFLRYDWLAALLGATALLRRQDLRWAAPLAGALGGAATTLRMFPALYFWGPLARGLWGLSEGVVRRPLLAFAGAAALTAVALQGAATLRYGTETVVTHFENMSDHNSSAQLSSRRIGLALALVYRPWHGADTDQDGKLERSDRFIQKWQKEQVEGQKPLRYGLAVAGTALLGLALRRKRDDEAFAWGFLPFFLFTTASYYYYVARAPLVLVHAARLDRWRHRVGLATLLAIEAWTSFCEQWFDEHRVLLIGSLAWLIVLHAAVQLGWMIAEGEEPEPTPPG